MLLNTLINSLEDGIEWILSKFANEPSLSQVAGTLEDRIMIQIGKMVWNKVWNKLDETQERQVPTTAFTREQSKAQIEIEGQLVRLTEEKNMGILVDRKLTMSQ